MRNLIWFNNVDIDTFYPRCYDLNDPEDIENFTENFKTTKAEAVLKTYIRLWRSKDPLAESMRDKAKIALNICERLTRDLDELVNDKVNRLLILIIYKSFLLGWLLFF
jgi:tubulin monoglycylase TTLL3/8